MSDETPTQPTLKTVLEAINSLGVELHQFRVAVEDRFKQVDTEVRAARSEVSVLRQEMNERFDDLDERMEVLAGDVIKARARSKRLAVKTEPPVEDQPEDKRA